MFLRLFYQRRSDRGNGDSAGNMATMEASGVHAGEKCELLDRSSPARDSTAYNTASHFLKWRIQGVWEGGGYQAAAPQTPQTEIKKKHRLYRHDDIKSYT